MLARRRPRAADAGVSDCDLSVWVADIPCAGGRGGTGIRPGGAPHIPIAPLRLPMRGNDRRCRRAIPLAIGWRGAMPGKSMGIGDEEHYLGVPVKVPPRAGSPPPRV